MNPKVMIKHVRPTPGALCKVKRSRVSCYVDDDDDNVELVGLLCTNDFVLVLSHFGVKNRYGIRLGITNFNASYALCLTPIGRGFVHEGELELVR